MLEIRRPCKKCHKFICRCENDDPKPVDDYLYNEKFAESNNSIVYKSFSLTLLKDVALKKIRLEKDKGVPITAIPEISRMRELKHPNIVSLMQLNMEEDNLFLVFEFVSIDLKKYLDALPQGKLLETNVVKNFLHQIIQGIEFSHSNGIFHRELKPQNMLIDNKGVIKLADFGLARNLDIRAYTLGVDTKCYHAPEVLLGVGSYSFAIDIWSIGCIFSEMVTRRPLFHTDSDSQIEQLKKIFSIMSTPTEETWPGVSGFPGYKNSFPMWPDNNLKLSVNELDPQGLDLLQKMLVYMPSKRINAKAILKHSYL